MPEAGATIPLPQRGAAGRLRAAAVNAFALLALLGLALAFRVVWRGDATLGEDALRPSTLLRALGKAPASNGAFPTFGVRSGTCEQANGSVLLYVRGEVLSRAAVPVAAIRVLGEVVRDGVVVARGEGLAGAVPTAEELHEATDRGALDALAARLDAGAPAVAPGERVPFLLALPDAPADLTGVSVRAWAEASGGGAGEATR
jgi:Meckel syndrome type 1 protein